MGARDLIGRWFGRMAVSEALAAPPAPPERLEPTLQRAAAPRPAPRPARRNGFAAAAFDRFTEEWSLTPQAMDIYLRQGLRGLRARSRSLEINNDYMRAFLRRVKTNVIGPEGMTLQVMAEDAPGKSDDKANARIKGEFEEFSKLGNCTSCGRFSFVELQQLAVKLLARDGELLMRRVRGYKNRWGYALQVMAVDQLDESATRAPGASQNEIRMGVEIDVNNRPVAYWVWRFNPVDVRGGGLDRQEIMRIPAEEIIHVYIVEDPGQSRGFPWACSSMRRLQMMGGYEEAALIAARTGASKMGFFTTKEESENPGPPQGERDEDGALITDADPGTFEALPAGMDFKEWNPAYPHGEMPTFMKQMLRGSSAGMGVAYEGLSGDRESVNFSSIRGGMLDERDEWRAIQSFVRDHFHNVVFADWLAQSLLTGVLGLPVSKFEKFNKPHWHARGWDWVDPRNDIEAQGTQVALGVTSRTRVAAQRGVEFEQIMKEQAAEREIAARYGVELMNPSLIKGQPAALQADQPVKEGATNAPKQ